MQPHKLLYVEADAHVIYVALMHLSRLILSWEDVIRIASNYSVLLLVTWSPCCYLNV